MHTRTRFFYGSCPTHASRYGKENLQYLKPLPHRLHARLAHRLPSRTPKLHPLASRLPRNQSRAVFRRVERRETLVRAQKTQRPAHRVQRTHVARSQSQRLDQQTSPGVHQARQTRQARQDQPHSTRTLDYL